MDADDEGNGTYDRFRKDSFYWYKKVIASNGKDLEDIKNNWMVDRTFVPVLEEKTRTERIQGWKKAVKYAYGWAKQTEI